MWRRHQKLLMSIVAATLLVATTMAAPQGEIFLRHSAPGVRVDSFVQVLPVPGGHQPALLVATAASRWDAVALLLSMEGNVYDRVRVGVSSAQAVWTSNPQEPCLVTADVDGDVTGFSLDRDTTHRRYYLKRRWSRRISPYATPLPKRQTVGWMVRWPLIALRDSIVVFGHYSVTGISTLSCLRSADGWQVWQLQFPRGSLSHICNFGNDVACQCAHSVRLIDGATGKTISETKMPGNPSGLATTNGLIVAATSEGLVAIRRNGSVAWHTPAPIVTYGGLTRIWANDRLVLVSYSDKGMAAYSPSGVRLWETEFQVNMPGPGLLAFGTGDEVAFKAQVGDNAERIYLVNERTGAITNHFDLAGWIKWGTRAVWTAGRLVAPVVLAGGQTKSYLYEIVTPAGK